MPVITYIETNGMHHPIDAEVGANCKDAALNAGLSGIVGLCGGFVNCGTCHVFVDAAWVDRLPQMDEAEDMMLEGTLSERQENSRLACQLVITPEMEGLILAMPSEQI
jgi:ferredoxin, 2Fe-2S